MTGIIATCQEQQRGKQNYVLYFSMLHEIDAWRLKHYIKC